MPLNGLRDHQPFAPHGIASGLFTSQARRTTGTRGKPLLATLLAGPPQVTAVTRQPRKDDALRPCIASRQKAGPRQYGFLPTAGDRASAACRGR
jgi:hypothetical protein